MTNTDQFSMTRAAASRGFLAFGLTAALLAFAPASYGAFVAPTVGASVTNEDAQSALIVINQGVADDQTSFYKITGITNGTLDKSDGTTAITNNDFITLAEGTAGVKFTPNNDEFSPATANFSFTIEADDNGSGGGLGGAIVATITVDPVADTPGVTNATTNEDIQTTSGLVISRNANDGTEVTHFKFSAITNGALFKNDGTTSIAVNDFITFAEGNAGLKFTPAADSIANGSFQIQGATSGAGAGLGLAATATVTVTAIADTPSVTGATTNEDIQTTSGLVISRNANDSTEVTHFKITTITNGSLFQNNGTTSISNNAFITFAQGNAGLKFTPTGDFSGAGSFQIQASTSNANGGLGGSVITANITVDPLADTPSVTDATTNEDTQTSSGLVISRNGNDSTEVTHFKITSITNGSLFQNDGTTAIANSAFITFAQGNAGLKFTPTADFSGNGSFQVQASTSNVDGGIGGSAATATITVNAIADTPSVTNATTNEDTQSSSGLVISRNANDSTEVTHFKITGITNGTLFRNDGTTPVLVNAFVTFAQGNAGLKFTPTSNFSGTGSFQVQASTSSLDGGLGGSIVTPNITVVPVADTPSITNAATNEDTQTTSGLVISRNATDSTEVTHFRVTSITNGTLFQNDGTTAISNSAFITFAQGNAGLKFTPASNSSSPGSFQIQASTSNVDGGLGGSTATATIAVSAIADTPSVTNATTNEDTQSSSGLVISRNANDSTEVSHFKITNITNGSLFQNNGTTSIADNAFITFAQGNAGLKFTPSSNTNTAGTFDIQGATSNIGAGLGLAATATITITPLNDAPVLDNTGDLALVDIAEDSFTNVGTQISAILAAGTITDVDAGAIEGVAVTALSTANGAWEFSLNAGANWTAFGSVSAGSATLLADDELVRFVPSPNFSGTVDPGITFKAWDLSDSNASGAAGINASVGGNATAFSTATETAKVGVVVVNDAPVLNNGGDLVFGSIAEDPLTNGGTLVSAMLSSSGTVPNPITDLDSAAQEGIAVIAANTANGDWQFSTNGGTLWTSFGPLTNTAATVVFDTHLVRFVPALNFNGAVDPGITFRAWDRTDLSPSGTQNVDASATGGTNAFSSATETASLTVTSVNDAPVVNDDAAATDENNFVDIAVLGNDSDVDNVIANSTVVVTVGPAKGSTGVNPINKSIRYSPDPDSNGIDTFTYRVTDTGNPLLSNSAVVTVTVNAINDPPVAINDTTLTNVNIAVEMGVRQENGICLGPFFWICFV